MKKHSGMRPHDILILLKIALYKHQSWLMKDLARDLRISPSEISESVNRSAQAALLSQDKRSLMRMALLEFLQFGLPYAFPQKPGAVVRGIPTAHSAPPLNAIIQSDENYVWPSSRGTMRGQAIEPLYKSVPQAIEKDSQLYEMLALVDAVRVGKARERELAVRELGKRIA
jgi:hypothetical protein